MHEAYKPLGLIAISVTWLAISVLVYTWRGHSSLSISKHAAAYRHAYLMMALVESFVLPLFLLFIVIWFTPTFNLPALFPILIALSSVGFLIAAWIPDTKGWQSLIHGIAAYGAAALFIPATIVLCLSTSISAPAQALAYVVLVYQLACIVIGCTLKRAKVFHLYFQTAYIFLFHALILTITYVR